MNMMNNSSAHDIEIVNPPQRADSLDIKFLARKFLLGLPIILVAMVAGTLAAGLVIRSIPPSFTSSTSILIDPKRPDQLGADTQFGSFLIDASKIANVEVMLVSSSLLERVVDSLHLVDDPAFAYAHPSPFDRVRGWFSEEKLPPPSNSRPARLSRAIDAVRRMIRTGRVGTTYVIKVDVSAHDPDFAQRVARALGEAYLADLAESRIESARADAAWLQNQLTVQRKELLRSEDAVENLRHQLGIVGDDNTQVSAVDRQSVTQVNEQLLKTEGDLAAARSRYENAQSIVRSGGPIEGLADIANSHVIQDLRKQQSDISERLADMSTRYAPDHPTLKRAEQEKQAIDRQVASEVARVLESLKSEYQITLAHRDELANDVSRLVGKVNERSSAEGRVELREATRIADANRVSYEALLNRLREVQEQQSRSEVEARIISEPDVPERPSFPKLTQILPIGSGLGLVLGCGLVLLLPMGKRQVEDAQSAERDLLLPVLALVPMMKRNMLVFGKRRLSIPEYLTSDPYSPLANQMRILRLRLRNATPGPCQVVQLTSAVPSEGKSTLAACLAISAANSDARTVLVDLDLHRPAAESLLGSTSGQRVVDILSGRVEVDAALQAQQDFPVTVINGGGIERLTPGMLEGKQLRDLLVKLRRDFDFIILDTPPVLSVSDALYISELADATLMVVAWRSTPRSAVNTALDALRAAHAPVVGLALNKVSSSQFGEYYGKPYRAQQNLVTVGRVPTV